MSFQVPQGAGTDPSAAASLYANQASRVPQASLMGNLSKTFPQIATSLQTFGALKSGIDQSNALRYNAQSYATEGAIAGRQGAEQEAQTRRQGSMALGHEAAAVGTAGAGYGGSAGRAMAQSAVNTQLDALNIRYKAQLQKWAFGAQAQNLQDEAKTARTGAFLKAGASLLTGFSKDYTAA